MQSSIPWGRDLALIFRLMIVHAIMIVGGRVMKMPTIAMMASIDNAIEFACWWSRLESIQDWMIERRGKYLMQVLQCTFLARQEAILYIICPLLSMEYASPMRGTSMRGDFGKGQSQSFQHWGSQIHSGATSNALHLWRSQILATSSLRNFWH